MLMDCQIPDRMTLDTFASIDTRGKRGRDPGPSEKYMSLSELYAQNTFVLSYELFPPKSDEGRDELRDHLIRLLAFNPHYITCTYGAGGSTREGTLATLALVRELTDVPVASHLTCVASTVDDLRTYLRRAVDQGVAYIVAIRGDAPKDSDGFQKTEGGLAHASDLVHLIHTEFPALSIAVGGYPETHPEAPSPEKDLEYLKRKVDAGADVVTTQLFFDNDDFYRFRDRCAAIGIDVPIVPGLLPVTSYPQIKRISEMSGAALPKAFGEALQQYEGDTEGQFQVGVEFATRQATGLVDAGVPGIHFYVLNKSRATTTVLQDLALPGR